MERLPRRRRSNEAGLSRKQTSLNAKIDIFFRVHGNGDYGLGVVGNIFRRQQKGVEVKSDGRLN
jgi:hypothetical protein